MGDVAGAERLILEYGADPTGKEDSTYAIEAAGVTIANAGGGELVFPPDPSSGAAGTYLHSGLTYHPGVRWRGQIAGNPYSGGLTGARLVYQGAGDAVVAEGQGVDAWQSNVVMQDLLFDTADGVLASSLFHVWNPHDFVFSRCRFMGNAVDAIHFDNSSIEGDSVTLESCRIEAVPGNGRTITNALHFTGGLNAITSIRSLFSVDGVSGGACHLFDADVAVAALVSLGCEFLGHGAGSAVVVAGASASVAGLLLHCYCEGSSGGMPSVFNAPSTASLNVHVIGITNPPASYALGGAPVAGIFVDDSGNIVLQNPNAALESPMNLLLASAQSGGGEIALRPNGAGSTTGQVYVTNEGSLTISAGLLTITSPPAFVAGDHYLVIDSTGQVHVSSVGPSS